MQISPSADISLNLKPATKINPSQSKMITTTHLLSSYSDADLNAILELLAKRPSDAEQILAVQTADPYAQGFEGSIKTLYSSLRKSSETQGTSAGHIAAPPLKQIAQDLKPLISTDSVQSKSIVADVEYEAVANKKPRFCLADHLMTLIRLSQVQIPAQYARAQQLYHKLKWFDEWKKDKLRNIYLKLGEVHREFFERFNPTEYHIYGYEDLSKEFDLHYSTIWRLLEGRFVRARNLKNEELTLPSSRFCVTKERMEGYWALQSMNSLLASEFKNKNVMSDDNLADKISPPIARRTVTKYRKEHGIPNSREREKIYADGAITAPYQAILHP